MSRFRLAWIQIRSQIGQLAVAIIVIALGVALSAGMLLANAALRESFDESIDALAGRADLVVSPRSGGTMDQAVLDQVRKVPGIAAAAPLLLGDGFVERDASIRVRVIGVDMLDDATVRVYGADPTSASGIQDPLIFLSQLDSVIAPKKLLDQLEVVSSSAVAIRTPQGRTQLKIRGVLSDRGVSGAFAGRLLIMDLFAAQMMFGAQDRITQIDARVSSHRGIPEALRQLRAVLPPHISVEPVGAKRAGLSRMVAGFQAMLNGISVLGLLLGGIITANRMTTVYQERMWEMGVLRGLGWSPRGLVLELLAEAILLAAIAVGIGLVLGVMFARVIVGPVGDTMALNFKQLGQADLTRVDARLIPLGIAAIAGTAAALLATWLPARHSARATIAALKARRRRRDPPPDTLWRRWSAILGPTAALAALAATWLYGSGIAGAVAMVALLFSGTVLLRPALVVVGRVVGSVLGEAAAVGVRDQSRAPSRAIGAAAILMVGVGLVVWIGCTGGSFERFVVNSLMTTRQGDLVIDSALNDQFGAVGENEPRLEEGILNDLRAVPGISLVGADVSARSLEPETGILAIDPIRLREGAFGTWILHAGSDSGALEKVAASEGVLADTNLVANRGLRIGEATAVMTPNGRLVLPLVGVVEPSFQSPSGDLILSRELYRQYWGDRTVTRIFAVLAAHADKEEVARYIRDHLGERYNLRVITTTDLAGWFSESVNRAFAFLDAMALLTIMVVVVGAADALSANVLERMREIGTMRSLGYRPAAVGCMVFAQSLAIGLVGGSFAVALGIGLSWAFVRGLLQAILGWQLESYLAQEIVLTSASLGIVACLLGGILPAIKASRLPIAETLRYE